MSVPVFLHGYTQRVLSTYTGDTCQNHNSNDEIPAFDQDWFSDRTQRLQYPLIEDFTLNQIRDLIII